MKQRSFTIRNYGAFLAVLLVLSLVFGPFAGIPAQAEDGAPAVRAYEPDRTGEHHSEARGHRRAGTGR